MPVKAEAGTDEFDPIANFCYERFAEGRGVTIEKPNGKSIFLIPEKIARDGATGLLIMDEERGSYLYKGYDELDEYVLVQAGFSLRTGIQVSKIVNALSTHFGWGSESPNDAANPQLTYQQKEGEIDNG